MRFFAFLLAALDLFMGALAGLAYLFIGLASLLAVFAITLLLHEVRQNPALLPDAVAYVALLAMATVAVWAVWPTDKDEK